MNNIEINNLLNKYWNAETSLHEELKLKEYFNSAQIAEEHAYAAPLFEVIKIESNVHANGVEIKAPTAHISKKSKIFQLNKTWKAIAAVLL